MRISCLAFSLICGFLLSATTAFAHRDYEREAGSFRRSDGETVSIVRHYEDGILLADMVSIQFRLSDGTKLSRSPRTFDVIVRAVSSGVEVYQFPTTWLPIASRIDQFDGYRWTDMTSSRRLVSLPLHFAEHWLAYLIALGLGAFFVCLCFVLRIIPKRGSYAALRWVGFAFIWCAGILCAYEIFMFEPISPFVLLASATVLFRWVRGIRRHRLAATA